MTVSDSRRTLLIIDDDEILCHAISDYLSNDKLEVILAHTGSDGLKACSRKTVDVVLLDQKLPDSQGHTLCSSILDFNDQTKIIFITAYPSFDNALRAIKAGAYDYLSKPFELEEMRLVIGQALRTLDLERVEQLQSYRDRRESAESVLIGSSKRFGEVRELIKLAATADAPVLITGETGTGKNIVAKSIHYKSMTKGTAFISVNCAALPENLIEAELFGHEKGAFTGASSLKKGVFEMAEGGTLLLDEIGEMDIHLQSKLLSVLEDKMVKRLGGESARPVNVRIIAATNTDLEASIEERRFRQDLYYRLSVVRIHLPPLRARKQDIPELCNYLITRTDRSNRTTIQDSEIERLMEYRWPGNVRELKNIIERAIILGKGKEIRPSELVKNSSADTMSDTPATPSNGGRIATLKELEETHIKYALDSCSWNYSRTARALGISLSTLKRKIKSYNSG